MERRKKRRGMKKRERKKRESKNGREEPHHPVADPSLEPNLPCPVMKVETKNSRMPPYGVAPWLVFSHGKREKTKTFFNVSEGSYYVRNIPEMRGSDFLACCYGWLVMLNKTSDDLFLLNAVSLQKIQLPYFSEDYSLRDCVLSSPPTDPDCVILCIVCSTDFFIYCHPGGDKWIKRKYGIPKEEASIWELLSCNGKLYTYDFTRLGIIDVNADPPLTWLEEPKSPKSPPLVETRRDYMVESCGDIFLARLFHLIIVPRVSIVEVYKMDFDRMVWVKVDTLGDRVLFLGSDYSTSCSASDSGIKRDCIYFTKPKDKSLYVFHLDRGTISMKLPCPNVRLPWVEPFWVMPAV
ncbi:uncharacterized protein LOC131227747 [Magnolia sinica]|uniref:uncharacterized protein LOC131227747 n=1 Tax=Magnolia sinica TaxID=86752 RepID=UPI00265944FD|nr:uncharacterized protein LOC131227747 [Magnolia sinica]XP_058079533.1 uncharacterized protein LOC131227747 [Magnolia sinica]